jgi:hypothetical protein
VTGVVTVIILTAIKANIDFFIRASCAKAYLKDTS